MVEREQKGWMIEPTMDIPPQKMFSMGCNYTDVAMGLKYFGYSDVTPIKFFEFVHNKPYDEEAEKFANIAQRTPRANAVILTDAIKEYTASPKKGQTALDAWFLNQRKIDLLKEKGVKINPFAVLAKEIAAGNPCITRFPAHSVLMKGFKGVQYPNGEKLISEYIYNDPMSGRERRKQTHGDNIGESFSIPWSLPEPGDTDTNFKFTGVDGRYLMIVMKPKK